MGWMPRLTPTSTRCAHASDDPGDGLAAQPGHEVHERQLDSRLGHGVAPEGAEARSQVGQVADLLAEDRGGQVVADDVARGADRLVAVEGGLSRPRIRPIRNGRPPRGGAGRASLDSMRPKLTSKGSSRGRRTRRSSRASRRSGAGGATAATFDAFLRGAWVRHHLIRAPSLERSIGRAQQTLKQAAGPGNGWMWAWKHREGRFRPPREW